MQNDIEIEAINNYQQNILYFQKQHPDLFQKLSSLEMAINNGHYKEKYSLEYKEEGYFDVLEIKTSKYLYGSNSNKHAKLAAQSINYDKIDNLFETFYDVVLEDEIAASYDDAKITDSQYSASSYIINYHNKYAAKETTTMKKIYKYIFFGTGLGLHLNSIHNKIDANVYLIVEDDLELFRLSLFTMNYQSLENNNAKLFFSIFDDEKEFKEVSNKFLQEMFIYNHFIKYFQILSHDDHKTKEFQKIVVSQSYLVFNYSALTSGMIRPLIHIKEKYNFLNISEPFRKEPFSSKPFLLLGAGPSLYKNIEWLKKHQDQFTIVAVSAMLAGLEENGIKPSIVTHVHGFDDAEIHAKNIKDISFFDETIFLYSTFSTPNFLSYFKKENIFLFQGTSEFKKGFSSLGSSNIGSLTYGLFLLQGTKNMYLLGLDFAIDSETGTTHNVMHQYTKSLNTEKTEYALEDSFSYTDSVIETEGNFKEKVKTNLLFNSFKSQFNLFSEIFKKDDQKVYNLSDGAALDGTIPLQIKDIQQDMENLNHQYIFQDIHKIYEENSENFITTIDIENIQSKLNYMKKLDKIVDSYSRKKYSTIDKFHYNMLGLFMDILAEEKEEDAQEINDIITMYLQYISGFIFDIINTKELDNEKHHIKALNKIVISQIKKLVTFYKEYLEKYLESLKEENIVKV